jgi:hypothetical protein
MADPGLFSRFYRILTWVTFVGVIVTIFLVLRKPAAPQVAFDRDAAARAQQKFEAAEQAKAAGQPSHVDLDRTELNSYLAQNLETAGPHPNEPPAAPPAQALAPASGSPASPGSNDPTAGIGGADQPTLEEVQSSVKDVKVDMDGDLVKAYVIFDFHGKDMSLELDGHLSAEGGYMRFDPVSGKLGSLPLPQSTLNAAVEKLMNSPETREKLRLPSDINDIHIVDGHAVIDYK